MKKFGRLLIRNDGTGMFLPSKECDLDGTAKVKKERLRKQALAKLSLEEITALDLNK